MKKGNLLWVCVLCRASASWEAWDSKICTSPFSAFSVGHVTDKFAGSIAFTCGDLSLVETKMFSFCSETQ